MIIDEKSQKHKSPLPPFFFITANFFILNNFGVFGKL